MFLLAFGSFFFGVFLLEIYQKKQRLRKEFEEKNKRDFDYELADQLDEKTFGNLLKKK